MPPCSSRTTRVTLACVLRPTVPYTTWTPASSRTSAQLMLFCSSKRAVSSTNATTCLPASAARVSERMIGLTGPEVRYSVCLMARTRGSSAARSMNASTVFSKLSYGWWTRTCCWRRLRKMSELGGAQGGRGLGRRHRRPGPVLQLGAVQLPDVEEAAQVEWPGDAVHVLRLDVDLAHQQVHERRRHVRSTSMRTTSGERRRCCRTARTASTRSSASSSLSSW